jgi:serine/threonine-protein kinase
LDRTVSIIAGSDLASTAAHQLGPDRTVLAKPAAPASTDLGELLRRRLRVIAGVAAVATSSGVSVTRLPYYEELLSSPTIWTWPFANLISHLLLLLPLGWAFAMLSPSRNLTLPRLRLVEFVIFSSICAFLAWDCVWIMVGSRHLLETHWGVFARFVAWPFGLTVVVYGVLIPNTWRRCAGGVGLIYGVAYLASALEFLLAPQSAKTVVSFLVMLTIWLGMSGVVIVFGAYRVEILRKAAERGRELGQYVLREKLGAGGMGEVYRAEHAFLRRPCAIKLIHPEKAGDPATLERFEREVQATATLTHPNTVQVYDYGRADDGTFYYVMEYLPGVTLDRLVAADGPLAPGRAVHLLRQVCGALAEAHAVGLVHRDVKPGNVLVGERGGRADVAKLLDFGLVAPTDTSGDGRLTQLGTVAGTPAFMSPEQAGGDDSPGPAADVYAVGAVAYFLLTGRPPFDHRSAVKLLAAHLHETPAPPSAHRPGVPTDLEAVVLRCLAKPPADRYPDAAALDAALASCGCSRGQVG